MEKRKEKPDIFGRTLLKVEFSTNMEEKNPYIDKILDSLKNEHLIEEEMGLRLVLDEAITNCIRHGNKRDPALMVRIHLFRDELQWGIVLEDEGEGFPPKELPDFDDPEALFAEGGRGLFLMHHYMDSVNYCGSGNILEMTKKIK